MQRIYNSVLILLINNNKNGCYLDWESDLAATLCWAASEGDLLEIKRLVAAGYDLNEADYDEHCITFSLC